MSRLNEVLDLPYIVLKRYHAGFALKARAQDSEAVKDLVAEGHLKLVKLDRTLPPDLVGEDFRLRCLAILRKRYRRLYHQMLGLSWRRKTRKMEPVKTRRPHVIHVDVTGRMAFDFSVAPRHPADGLMQQEVQEFLDNNLQTAQRKAVTGVLEGRSKNDVGRELGLSPNQLNRILGDAVVEMQEGGVL